MCECACPQGYYTSLDGKWQPPRVRVVASSASVAVVTSEMAEEGSTLWEEDVVALYSSYAPPIASSESVVTPSQAVKALWTGLKSKDSANELDNLAYGYDLLQRVLTQRANGFDERIHPLCSLQRCCAQPVATVTNFAPPRPVLRSAAESKFWALDRYFPTRKDATFPVAIATMMLKAISHAKGTVTDGGGDQNVLGNSTDAAMLIAIAEQRRVLVASSEDDGVSWGVYAAVPIGCHCDVVRLRDAANAELRCYVDDSSQCLRCRVVATCTISSGDVVRLFIPRTGCLVQSSGAESSTHEVVARIRETILHEFAPTAIQAKRIANRIQSAVQRR